MGGFPATISLMRVNKSAVRQALAKLVPTESISSGPPPSALDDQWLAWAVSQIHLAREYASEAAYAIGHCLTPVASTTSIHQLRMFGGWKDEQAYERALRLLCWGVGVPNFMPENEENTFFVLYTPAQLQIALNRISEALPAGTEDAGQTRLSLFQDASPPMPTPTDQDAGPTVGRIPEQRLQLLRSLNKVYRAFRLGEGDKDNQQEMDDILHFLNGSVLCGDDTAILFTNPP